jgi:hypothetical protein
MPTPQPIPPDGALGELPPDDLTATAPAPTPPQDHNSDDIQMQGTEYELPDSPRPSSAADNSSPPQHWITHEGHHNGAQLPKSLQRHDLDPAPLR